MPTHTISANDQDQVFHTADGVEGFHVVSNAQRLVDAGVVASRRELRSTCDEGNVVRVSEDGSERPVGFLERFTLASGDVLRIGDALVRLTF